MRYFNTLLSVFLLISIQFASAQEFEWAAQFSGGDYVYANDLAVDLSGNVYATGFFAGSADFDPASASGSVTASGVTDAFLSKTDASGALLWVINLGETESTIGSSLLVDASDNVILAGNFQGTVDFDPGPEVLSLTSAGNYDVFICKFSESGNLIWAESFGGPAPDQVNEINIDLNDNIYVTGYFEGTSDFDPQSGVFELTSSGFRDVFVSKLDSSGELDWALNIGGPSTDFANSVAIDLDQNVYLTGYFKGTVDFDPGLGSSTITSGLISNAFICKLDASGNYLWAKSPENGIEESGYAIAVDGMGNSYTVGTFKETVDFDPGTGISSLSSAGESDMFILKLDPSGNFSWVKQIGGSDSEIPTDIAIDENANVFSTGYFLGTADFDPGAGVENLTSAGGFDIFVSKISATGDYRWGFALGAAGTDFGQIIKVGPDGYIYTGGYYQGTVDFDPTDGVQNLTVSPDSDSDSYIQKLSDTPVNIQDILPKESIQISPNPVSDNFMIRADDGGLLLDIAVYNVTGQLVANYYNVFPNRDIINFDHAPGTYFVELRSGETLSVFKMIKN